MTKCVMVGTYVPRQCGIATFSKDLRDGLCEAGCQVTIAAVTDTGSTYAYPPEVGFRIRQERLPDYLGCASWINSMPDIDLVIIQHEYGIFGGQYGEYILEFAGRLNKPYILVCHTVLPRPLEKPRYILTRLITGASGIVCMTGRARNLLADIYNAGLEGVHVIPHGVPAFQPKNRDELKAKYDMQGKTIITTFGLIGPGKGLENGIQAIARIIDKFPQVVYIIAGGTHPVLLKREGESYREKIKNLVSHLNLENHVRFVNKYLDLDELRDYLYMTDVYLSPYPNMDQAVSGTLSFAVGCGRAVVSTPYEHARELLADGRGLLAKDADPASIAEKLEAVLSRPELKNSLEAKASEFGTTMTWSSIARRYMEVAKEVLNVYAGGSYLQGKNFLG